MKRPEKEQLVDELKQKLGGYMQAPMTQFATVMNSLLSNFAGAVEALKAQRESA